MSEDSVGDTLSVGNVPEVERIAHGGLSKQNKRLQQRKKLADHSIN